MNRVVAEKEYQKQQANLGWELKNRCNSLGVEARHAKHLRASERKIRVPVKQTSARQIKELTV